MVLAILGGGSRAGFIAVSVVGLWLIITSRRKGMALVLVAGAVLAFLAFAPDDITSRLTTIKEAGEDSSFMGHGSPGKSVRPSPWKIPSLAADFMRFRFKQSGTNSKCLRACSVFEFARSGIFRQGGSQHLLRSNG